MDLSHWVRDSNRHDKWEDADGIAKTWRDATTRLENEDAEAVRDIYDLKWMSYFDESNQNTMSLYFRAKNDALSVLEPYNLYTSMRSREVRQRSETMMSIMMKKEELQ